MCCLLLLSIGLSAQTEMLVQQGHVQKMKHVSFSRNGNFFATYGVDNLIKVWDAINGNLVRTFVGDRGMYHNSWISEDGDFILAGGAYKRFWKALNVETGGFIDSASNSKYYISAIDVGERSDIMATASGDNTITIWDASNGSRIKIDSAHKYTVERLVLSDDGSLLLSSDGTVKLWDAINGKLLFQFPGKAVSATLSKDGKTIAIGEKPKDYKLNQHYVGIWDVQSLTKTDSILAHKEYIYSVDLSGNGSVLATGGGDAAAKVWDVKSNELIKEFAIGGLKENKPASKGTTYVYRAKYTGTVGAVRLNYNGTTLLTSFRKREIAIWDIASGRKICKPEAFNSPVYSLAINKENQMVIASGNAVNVVDLKSLSLINSLSIANPRAVSLDGQVLSVATADGISSLSHIKKDTLMPSKIACTHLLLR